MAATDHESFLRQADALGWSVAGTTSPNPPVGCVIVNATGQVVGGGATEPPREVSPNSQGRHAEIVALDAAGRAAQGATAYVTLEPCNHQGRTSPCAEALVDAGIAEVHYLFADPGATAGGGAQTLRAAGVAVTGPYVPEGANPHRFRNQCGGHRFSVESWLMAQRLGRPSVTLKYAATLNGMAAATDKTSQWITGELARADVHSDRCFRDAIIVGTGTVLADDPQLTARPGGLESPRQPRRVVIGTRELPADARVFRATEHAAPATHLRTRNLEDVLAQLWSEGCVDVLVEGGPQLAAEFLAAGLVDQVRAYLAPAWLPIGLPAMGTAGRTTSTITDIERFSTRSVQVLGEDILWQLDCPPHRG